MKPLCDDDFLDIFDFIDGIARTSIAGVTELRLSTGTGTDIGGGHSEFVDEGESAFSERSILEDRQSRFEDPFDSDRTESEGLCEEHPSTVGEILQGFDGGYDSSGDDEPEDIGEDAPNSGGQASSGGVHSSVKFYGHLRRSKNKKFWLIECEPQVALRIKRVFPKAKPSEKTIKISRTEEVSDELRWFFDRYPVQMEVSVWNDLQELADRWVARRSKVLEILNSPNPRPVPAMVVPPRDYQSVASEIAHTTGRLLVADEVGLGKTCLGLSLLARPGTLPAAIVLPTHLPPQWIREIKKFMPSLDYYMVETTNPAKEKVPSNPDVWIVPYSRLSGWSSRLRPEIKTVIFDEVHELRRDVSARYRGAQELSSEATYRLGLSATPVYNYGGEFFSVLGIIAPGELGSWDEFAREWCSAYHDKRKAKIADPVAFGSWLRDAGLLLRRTRKQVGRELPPLVRCVVDVEWNEEPFKEIENAIVQLATQTLHGKPVEAFRAAGDLDARIRHATGVAKAPAVAALVRGILETTEEPVVLFGWHRDVYAIWQRDLAEFKPVLYSGSENAKEKEANLQKFLRGDSKVLIMSLRSGQGVDGLQGVCHRVVHGELDWSPQAGEQCTGRIHRDDQKEPTMVYYPVCNEGSDPIMLDILDLKRWQHDGVVDPKGEKLLNVQQDPDHIKRLAKDILQKRGLS